MQASIVELRYHMKDVLKALDRNEVVQVLYRGKLKAKLVPERSEQEQKIVSQHPFFGMLQKSENSVEDLMTQLRRERFHDV